MRGYNVLTLPIFDNDFIKQGNELFKDKNGKFVDFKKELTEKEIFEILTNALEGSRYSVYIKWVDGGSHVFIAEKKNHITEFYDPQANVIDVVNNFGWGVDGYYGILRLDDKMITDDIELLKKAVELYDE